MMSAITTAMMASASIRPTEMRVFVKSTFFASG
jgi:hypothetical protein